MVLLWYHLHVTGKHLENSTQTALKLSVTSKKSLIGSIPIPASAGAHGAHSDNVFIRLLYSVKSETVEDGYFDNKMLYG